MIINGRFVEFDPTDGAIRTAMIEELANRIGARIQVSAESALGCAEVAFGALDDELEDAAAYRWLRDEICKLMADPNAWDGEEGEPNILLRFVQHLAAASHGSCDRCGRSIGAGEQFEGVPDIPGGHPWLVCQDCAG